MATKTHSLKVVRLKTFREYKAPPEKIRCEVIRVTRYHPSWEERHPDKRCSLGAVVKINGKPMCALHAGRLTLRATLQKGKR